ncbi:MAG TPA: MarR family transcriptional regulator [Marmoricola sp.]|nr:MarR family transcriptional regulator [Marmoricola sp.]
MPSVEQVCRTDSGLAASLRVSVARLHRRLRMEHADDVGVSFGAAAVLALLRREGDQTIGQLAAAERVRPPSMTRTVSCLEDDGLVARHPHPTDGRQVVISLTEQGEELLAAERRRRDAWLARRLRELTPDERAALRQAAPILERLSFS